MALAQLFSYAKMGPILLAHGLTKSSFHYWTGHMVVIHLVLVVRHIMRP